MISEIYAYGCSFVYGDGVKKEDAWPQLLGNKFNVPVFNRGERGGSNKFSLIRFFEDLKKFTPDTFIIFSWTGFTRTMFYSRKFNNWNMYLPGHVPLNEDNTISEDGENMKYFYANIYSDYDSLTTLYQQQLLLQNFLENNKLNYAFMNAVDDNLLLRYRFWENDSLTKNLHSGIKKEKYFLGYNNSLNKIVCKDMKLIAPDGYHPSEGGHKWIADNLYNFINAQ